METTVSILIGIGLSAATGFRIFLPFLVVSVAAYTGNLTLSESFRWIGTEPALIAFGTATVIEILAYFIPWLDNLLDTFATPSAVIAGAIIMVAVMADLPPLIKWALAIIAGGGISGIFQSGTTLLRLTSTSTTGGIANPGISAGEGIAAVILSILAIFLPVIAVVFVIIILLLIIKWRKKYRKDKAAAKSTMYV